ncbi:MAG: superoxide dismutase family protein [Clostridia bacterium]|nr:superoxide dismutase family protein [Clostridia bacterium]
MNQHASFPRFTSLLSRRPDATARVVGSPSYPDLYGLVRFYGTPYGVLVAAEVQGLPDSQGQCERPIFGFHLHEGGFCAGNGRDPFADAGSHYNPRRCPHPFHAGDLPPLFGSGGYAYSVFLTNEFTVDEIIEKTVIIHGAPDDFHTQPSGNSGTKIACGIILGRKQGIPEGGRHAHRRKHDPCLCGWG